MTTATGRSGRRLLTVAEFEEDLPAPSVGFMLGADGAWWFRMSTHAGLVAASSAPAARAPYEAVAFDGTKVVRWRRTAGPIGELVVREVPEDARPLTTLLAGTVESSADGWSRLVGRRRTRFEVPVQAPVGWRIVLDQREAISVDRYGNARVTSTLPVRLRAVPEGQAVAGRG